MKITKVGKRYAQSLLQLAVETGVLEAVKADIEMLSSTCAQSKDLVIALNSPVIKSDKKLNVLKAITSGNISVLTDKFITLIVTKGRADKLVEILNAFDLLYFEHKNIVKAQIKSVNGVSAEVKNQIISLVKQNLQKEVVLEEVFDKELIGGFVLTVGDKQVNASVKEQLDKLKKGFNYNPYLSKL
jgi:F-type H+-transporting ATPase subunit delta